MLDIVRIHSIHPLVRQVHKHGTAVFIVHDHHNHIDTLFVGGICARRFNHVVHLEGIDKQFFVVDTSKHVSTRITLQDHTNNSLRSWYAREGHQQERFPLRNRSPRGV
uniref:ORF128 n=1 Tax=Malaco herpesvirus 1 TaxID=3031797 RepID=A0AA48P967_9VIRU|nr:TPA_asm: ORF128 [Malaco herpesvirus 1]